MTTSPPSERLALKPDQPAARTNPGTEHSRWNATTVLTSSHSACCDVGNPAKAAADLHSRIERIEFGFPQRPLA